MGMVDREQSFGGGWSYTAGTMIWTLQYLPCHYKRFNGKFDRISVSYNRGHENDCAVTLALGVVFLMMYGVGEESVLITLCAL